ncbi:MAG: hypothetical protein NUV55_01245 [Sulfuricaulis sp.]|uniref:hypothetical protein n=1 Tax=Sulfuricaulis sp. TaxID=2003553 RepID=UPI0025E14985|nr:hypothetical protein [Sulfuricaulis sp.]MCR4345820.1 hypothetical protein [Sulfuricaulis sp.]
MRYSPKYAIQAGGDMRQWSNPERTFRFSLVKVNFDCEPDAYPGVLILTDQSYKEAFGERSVLQTSDPDYEVVKRRIETLNTEVNEMLKSDIEK